MSLGSTDKLTPDGKISTSLCRGRRGWLGKDITSEPSVTSYNASRRLCLLALLVLVTLSIPMTASRLFESLLGQPQTLFHFLPPPTSISQESPESSPAVLQVFQVSPPVQPLDTALCSQTLMLHVFASSYGRPYVGE